METGHEKVQGTDYVYTVQGWIKGVNANTLDEAKDPGKDATGYRPLVAKDVFAYSLHYNNFDYKSIAAGAADFIADQAGSDLLAAGTQLYNGNIGQMVTTITNPTTRDVLPLGNGYKYDQLNRLKESKSFTNLSGNSWGYAGSYDNKYFNKFTYDANGNILTQVRHDSTGTKIDDLAYKYERNFAGRLLRNRLYHVNDTVSPSLYSDDIDDMGTFEDDINFINTDNNYSYDGEGRLVKDKQEEIDSILWTVTGKVREIRRTPLSSKKNLRFEYDALGRRIVKHIYSSSDELEKSVYYVLDAQGNVMSTYEMNIDTTNSSLTYQQAEKYIYGSSRLGMLKDNIDVLGSAYTDTQMDSVLHFIGKKQYEFSNHLGNVLTTISDKPIPHDNGGTVDYFLADIKTAQDYSPFGVILSGRNFSNDTTEYRYAFQGQERDDEIKDKGNSYNYEYHMHDSRLGRFFSVDPLFRDYPFYSPYAFSGNRVIDTIELEGLEPNILFETKDQAAINFGKYYNDNSIREKKEYGTTIYQITDAETKRVISNYENFMTIDKNQFNSNKLKKIGENKFQAIDVYTKEKFNVIRDEKGKYKKDDQ